MVMTAVALFTDEPVQVALVTRTQKRSVPFFEYGPTVNVEDVPLVVTGLDVSPELPRYH